MMQLCQKFHGSISSKNWFLPTQQSSEITQTFSTHDIYKLLKKSKHKK